MSRLLRALAILIALAAVVDPVFAVRRPALLPIDVRVVPAGEPGHTEAVRRRDEILAALRDSVKTGSGEVPRVFVAVGNAVLPKVGDATVFASPLASAPRLSAVSAPDVEVLWGQQPVVSPSFRAQQLSGTTTTFRLVTGGGATLATAQHRWTTNDEVFAPVLAFSPVAPGLTVVRVVADTAAMPEAVVDVAVRTRDRRARVFVFEPRPSWAAGFARQSLESDPLFDVRAVARTSRGVATHTAGAPVALSALDPDSADVVLVGGLDVLSDADLDALGTFAADRGGTVLLVPDARLPEKVRRAFDLPQMTDTLLERPIVLRQGALSVRASEVLRSSSESAPHDAALLAQPRGRGQVILSTALDAWRYRAEPAAAFPNFWRAVVADAARMAVPALSVELESTVVRPGEAVRITARVRSLTGSNGGMALPRGIASVVAADGQTSAVRLWPGKRAGELVGEFTAAVPGHYNVHLAFEGLPAQDAVLVVDPAAARAAHDRSRELAFLAQGTGGQVLPPADVSSLVTAVRALPGGEERRDVRPTRSPWWVIAFVACVGAEWAMRRSKGLR